MRLWHQGSNILWAHYAESTHSIVTQRKIVGNHKGSSQVKCSNHVLLQGE